MTLLPLLSILINSHFIKVINILNKEKCADPKILNVSVYSILFYSTLFLTKTKETKGGSSLQEVEPRWKEKEVQQAKVTVFFNLISEVMTDISCWMKDHHLQLNLAKTEPFVVSAITSSQFHIPVRLINHNSFKNSQKPWSCNWW